VGNFFLKIPSHGEWFQTFATPRTRNFCASLVKQAMSEISACGPSMIMSPGLIHLVAAREGGKLQRGRKNGETKPIDGDNKAAFPSLALCA
jgi:hypothetical protein